MQPGQFLINAGGEKMKIFFVNGDLVVPSMINKFDRAGCNFTKDELKKNGWSLLEEPWVPSLGERYYYLDSYGEIETEEKENNACFQHRTLVGNVHRTEADVEFYKQKLIERMGKDFEKNYCLIKNLRVGIDLALGKDRSVNS